MGLNKKGEGQGSVFLGIRFGCIIRESKVKRPGMEPHVYTPLKGPNKGVEQTVWIERFDSISGLATKLEWYDREHNGVKYKGFKLHMTDEGVNFALDFPLNMRYTARFLKTAENINWNEPLEISAWLTKNEREQDVTAINFKQGGDSLKQYYNKDTAEVTGIPPGEYDDIEGEWDFRKQTRWLIERMKTHVIPIIEAAGHKPAAIGGSPTAYTADDEPENTEAPNPPRDAHGFPQDPLAKSMADLVTPKQLGMIRALAREASVDPDEECQKILKVRTEELSKRAASIFIDHLKAAGAGNPNSMPSDEYDQRVRDLRPSIPHQEEELEDDDIPF